MRQQKKRKKKKKKQKRKKEKRKKKKEKKMVVIIYTANAYLTIKRPESLVKPAIENESVEEGAEVDSSKPMGREKSISSSSAMSDQDRPEEVSDQLCCICFDPKSPSIWKIESDSEPL